jgi:hypothetical protein
MRGCHRPLKLTEFIAHAHFRGILISSCDLDASSAAELLRLMKNVSACSTRICDACDNEIQRLSRLT